VESRSVVAEGITQRFGSRVALDDVDLAIPAGEVVGLLGPNGAGKTTLLRILFGVIEPDAGRVLVDGRPSTDADRRSWGYMPQERGLYQDMRVIDLLVWLGRLHGLAADTGRKRSLDLLDQLGLADRAGDKIKELSGGMAQRVQLAATLVHDPPVVVLDEPFAGLDPVAVDFLSRVVVERAEAGRHVLFSSHQLELVEGLCERITMLHRGHVVLDGDVARLRAASPERFLRVGADVEPAWITGSGAEIATTDARGARLRLRPGQDAFSVLEQVRAHTTVEDFAVEAPTLSDLFLAAAGRPIGEAHEQEVSPAPAAAT
jgi:ABC-2 type transport system ATP-binding protein